MVDPTDAIGKARAAVTQRADLPGMSLMEHLDELRKRIVRSAIFLFLGFIIAYVFHERLYGLVQAPLDKLHIKLNYTHPMDPLNLYLQVSLIGGAILASPFTIAGWVPWVRCRKGRPIAILRKTAGSWYQRASKGVFPIRGRWRSWFINWWAACVPEWAIAVRRPFRTCRNARAFCE